MLPLKEIMHQLLLCLFLCDILGIPVIDMCVCSCSLWFCNSTVKKAIIKLNVYKLLLASCMRLELCPLHVARCALDSIICLFH
jgi:hypothetical protein